MVRQTRSVCSQAMRVLPEPPNGSSTMALLMEELRMGYAKSGTGFMVGWSLFFLGLSNSQMVDSFRPVYHWCLPFFFQPKRIGSCCHW